ncbi:MAG: ABC transporter permease [Lachnospiraceae bacterium]
MRFKNLLLWDMKFQARYGIYLLYSILTGIYVVLLLSLPGSWKENAAAMLIYSDPAAMGLFFMGAMILLEKSQRVTSFFAVSPIRVVEYVCSKVLSLSVIAVLVAAVLAAAANHSLLLPVLWGTFLSSVLFTLSGLIIATKITSLNQFIIAAAPLEIIAFVPAVLHLFELTPDFLRIYPGNVCMDLIAGRTFSVTGLILTMVLIAILFWAAVKCVWEMRQTEGGVKL